MKFSGGKASFHDRLVGLAGGHRAAAVLFSAHRLGIFETMASAPKTARQAALKAGCDPAATEKLLNALASLGLVRKTGSKFSLEKEAAAHLTRGGEARMGAFLDHSLRSWDSWARLDDAVKTGKAPKKQQDRVYQNDAEWTETFIMAMDQGSRERAVQLADALDLRDVRRVIDIGGGPGTYSYAMIEKKQDLTSAVFDLPGTLAVTRKLIMDRGFSRKVGTIEGDVREDGFGSDFDLALLSNILHCFGPADARTVLKKAAGCVRPGGRVVVNEFILNDDKAGPAIGALFSLNMLLHTSEGASHSPSEYKDWMKRAGLTKISCAPYCVSHMAVVGVRPKKGAAKKAMGKK